MADPFVAVHQLTPRTYDLSGRFEPASIRDQMIRAWLLVDRLFEQTTIKNDSRILVVGAGASGVTAGIAAAERGASVLIVDKEILPFLPLSHWELSRFPIDNSGMPLDWEAGYAANLATDWSDQLEEARENLGAQLLIEMSTECRDC